MGYGDIKPIMLPLPHGLLFDGPVIFLNQPLYTEKEMRKMRRDHNKFMRRIKKEDGKATNCNQ